MNQPLFCLVSLFFVIAFQAISQDREVTYGSEERTFFRESLVRIGDPILNDLANYQFKCNMPVEKADNPCDHREDIVHLEVVGRTLGGIAPRLEWGPDNTKEGQLRKKYIDLPVTGLANSVDPQVHEYLNLMELVQPPVDADFLAEGFLRAPNQLLVKLDQKTQQRFVQEYKKTRTISSYNMIWILFGGMIEAALLKFNEEAKMEELK